MLRHLFLILSITGCASFEAAAHFGKSSVDLPAFMSPRGGSLAVSPFLNGTNNPNNGTSDTNAQREAAPAAFVGNSHFGMTHRSGSQGVSSSTTALYASVTREAAREEAIKPPPTKIKQKPLKVLFLSSDTGGGHRASAEALAKQFIRHYPGTTYDLLDVWTLDGCLPYRTLVNTYKHLSAHPRQWKILYHLSNTLPYELIVDIHSTLTCERKIRRRIASYDADVIVSVHPTMNNVPMIATRKISKALGKYIPFFTVVTDFGSGHCTWFQKGVDKMYVASERIRRLARRRGSTPKENLIMSGLPIRRDFAIHAESMGDRTLEAGKRYQQKIRKELGLDPSKKTILVMGGGEGVGSLSTIVDALYAKFYEDGIDANICVVCGRNEKLHADFLSRNWTERVADLLKKASRRSFWAFLFGKKQNPAPISNPGQVEVVPLSFVTNMADYMVAADILVSKAGPGTIAEAAAVGLPVMLTSFLPGQEAGNVEIVLDGKFGDFQSHPTKIADGVACWLKDSDLWKEMSRAASEVGKPNAASDIVLDIGRITLECMEKNKMGDD